MDTQSIVAFFGICISAIAAAVTAWMAVETRLMATAATKALDLEQAPILGLRDVKVEVGVDEADPGSMTSVRVGMELFNAGRVPVRYTMKSLRVTFADRTTDAPRFLSRGARVLPGGSTVFWHPTLSLQPPVSMFPAAGRVRFEFEYSNESGRQPQAIVETVEYTISHGPAGWHVNWLTIDEPPAA